jgi:hypothetical protein
MATHHGAPNIKKALPTHLPMHVKGWHQALCVVTFTVCSNDAHYTDCRQQHSNDYSFPVAYILDLHWSSASCPNQRDQVFDTHACIA